MQQAQAHSASSQSPGQQRGDYLREDTIAAIATATGGAISIIRLSGPSAFLILNNLCQEDSSAWAPRTLHRALLCDPRQSPVHPIDDALAVRFPKPASFTGEDVVELHVHGGSLTAERALAAALSAGARQALPGEFSFRAVRNGKLTLSQAQAVSDLISSVNAEAANLALEKLSGSQSRLIEDLASGLRQTTVLAEAGIDFADQDIEEVSLPSLKKKINGVCQTLARLASSFERGQRIQGGIGVVFAGLPNAGKSSFFNSVLGEERSIVSKLAGTTRDVVTELITLRGSSRMVTLRLEDTAGLRETDQPIEREGILRTLRAAKNAEVLLYLVDCTDDLAAAHSQWRSLGIPLSRTIPLITKCDLRTLTELAQVRDHLSRLFENSASDWIYTSAVGSPGISNAIEKIVDFCGSYVHREPGEILLTRLNQVRAVQDCLEHLLRAQEAEEIDLFASDLRQALHALGPLIGETLPDDILGQIFSDFCIGK